MNHEAVAERIRAEFREMPGMALTLAQASRLFGLDHEECRTVLDRLVSATVLRRTKTGAITLAA
jgi:hypothetical protein